MFDRDMETFLDGNNHQATARGRAPALRLVVTEPLKPTEEAGVELIRCGCGEVATHWSANWTGAPSAAYRCSGCAEGGPALFVDKRTVGRRLSLARRLCHQDLTEAARRGKVAPAFLLALEEGRRMPPIGVLQRFCALYPCQMDWVLGRIPERDSAHVPRGVNDPLTVADLQTVRAMHSTVQTWPEAPAPVTFTTS